VQLLPMQALDFSLYLSLKRIRRIGEERGEVLSKSDILV
jgi:hypothetical protein